jgi:hypothetical protein
VLNDGNCPINVGLNKVGPHRYRIVSRVIDGR